MSFFSRPAPPPEPPKPPPPPPIRPQGTKEAQATKQQAARKKGQAAARVTGGQGLMTEAPTQKPSLLGQNKMGY